MIIKAIITAGGTSSRFGNTNKLLEELNGKEVIKHTVEKFVAVDLIDEVIICANKTLLNIFGEFFGAEKKIKIIEGGANRQASVYNGILAAENCDYVLIHDAARPLVSNDTIIQTISDVKIKKAISVMTKTTDTIKEVDLSGKIIKTLDRKYLYNTQTPQAFEYTLIKNAHEKFKGEEFTDDAGIVEAYGHDVYILESDYKNIKITSKSDMNLASEYLKNM